LRGRFILTRSDLTTTKWRRDRRNLFHNGNIIPAFMSPSRNLIL
jgi:hypothetical protein